MTSRCRAHINGGMVRYVSRDPLCDHTIRRNPHARIAHRRHHCDGSGSLRSIRRDRFGGQRQVRPDRELAPHGEARARRPPHHRVLPPMRPREGPRHRRRQASLGEARQVDPGGQDRLVQGPASTPTPAGTRSKGTATTAVRSRAPSGSRRSTGSTRSTTWGTTTITTARAEPPGVHTPNRRRSPYGLRRRFAVVRARPYRLARAPEISRSAASKERRPAAGRAGPAPRRTPCGTCATWHP